MADLPIHLVVIAKSPVPGRVKTRLTPIYTPVEAATLAEAALVDTLDAVLATPVRTRTIVVEGAVGAWLPAGLRVLPQRGDGLDERLAAAFDDAALDDAVREGTGLPLLLVGMDTPQLTPDLLARCAVDLLEPSTDAVLGLATDGGWWALGLRRPDPSLLLGIPMSTDRTGREQLARLRTAGLRVTLLPELTDVDDAGSAALVASDAPGSRFAAVLQTMAVQA